MTREDLYRKMEEGIMPTTSAPAPEKFIKAYRELAKRASLILSIHITSKLSAVYQTAVLARSMVPEIDVRVIDSLSPSMCTGFLALAAARASEAGKTVQEILAIIENIKAGMNVFATVDTLKYLQLSGRVGSLLGLFASLLDVKPIITVRYGLAEAIGRVRSRAKSLDRLLELTQEAVGGATTINAAIAHARALEEAQRLRKKIEAMLKCKEIFVVEITPALAVHAGPGVVGVISYAEQEGWRKDEGIARSTGQSLEFGGLYKAGSR